MGSRFRRWIRGTAAQVQSRHSGELASIRSALDAAQTMQRYHVDLGPPDRAQRDGGATRLGSYYYFTRDAERSALLKSGQQAVERLQDAIGAALAEPLGPGWRIRWPGQPDEDLVAILLGCAQSGPCLPGIDRVPRQGFLKV